MLPILQLLILWIFSNKDLLNVAMRIPHTRGIFQYWSNQGNTGSFLGSYIYIKLHAIANLYSINMWLYSYSATSRNQSILLLFSPIFFWKSFFWPIIYILKILLEVLIFYSQLSYMAIASYLTVTSYTLYTSTAHTHHWEL